MIYYNNKKITYLYFGEYKIVKRYLGNKLIFSALEQLAAPTIVLSGDTLSIVDNDGNATAFDIYVDGVKVASVPKSS